ncbi:MAG: 3'(2'),5'-bisphosphate nucleotidase CysQ [Thiotrichales bacterium]|nr:3'(2'),5'-bisphosphate nucleotidase CysQ [Thiotrichales bacterium]
MHADTAPLVDALRELADRAGAEILAVYASDFAVRDKDDASPVTEADTRAEHVILEGLARCAPGIPVVAEESVAAGHVPEIDSGPFFLVDPLDGTREFIGRNGEFTVNIALVEDGVPTAAVVHLPALGETCWTAGDRTAWRVRDGGAPERIACRRPGRRLVAIASRSHRSPETDAYLRRFEIAETVSAGSSLKFCRIAEGAADLYPRLGRTMEWDIAAGHAIVTAAGGSVETLDGRPLVYGKPGFENPHFVVRGLPPALKEINP